MRAFHRQDGLVVPVDRPNVDTDAIIPKQFLKSIRRTGFGPHLFDGWRYQDQGEPGQDCATRPLNPDFALNQARYRGAQILLARENFGCGSSREHAAWAMLEYGIEAVIAPSFADIFFSNCAKNGLLPVVLPAATVDGLFRAVETTPGYRLVVDLDAQTVTTPTGEVIPFALAPALRERFLRGLDEIGESLAHAEAIRAYEARRRQEAPWLFRPI
jgi:3-isopropylmalate/(R)-2-methylmalate dehydratase small subunit